MVVSNQKVSPVNKLKNVLNQVRVITQNKNNSRRVKSKDAAVLEGAVDQTWATHPHPNSSSHDVSNPWEAKALPEWDEVLIATYGFVRASTRYQVALL
jgi:hypothetical protein